jgi:hypothetical protein
MQRSKIGKGHASQFVWHYIYLDHENGGHAGEGDQMAANASASTTQLHDRREDRVTLDEIFQASRG